MKRRQFLSLGAVSLLAPDFAFADTLSAPTPYHFADVLNLARTLAAREDAPEKSVLVAPFAHLSYDQYRGIRFRPERNPLGKNSPFRLDLLPPGMLYEDRVHLYLVEQGTARELPFTPKDFDFQPGLFPTPLPQPSAAALAQMGWSGFRIRYPINHPDTEDEVAVFQGASYFRAVARNTLYGLSARGLALNTGNPGGEEFPRFSRFWIHCPEAGAHSIQVDALLESQSLTGAYSFLITPGAETVFTVHCSLFPRRIIKNFGIAPLTSMYYFSPARRANINDYREAVHDSDGLLMQTGDNQPLWRALSNPGSLQFSAFQDNNPQGFGLIQRARNFSDYQDNEAHYEARPSAWIIPHAPWGKGSVSLIEIPVSDEFNDNIVAFWQPEQALEPNTRTDFAYDLIWSATGVTFTGLARITATRSGRSVNAPATLNFSVDFTPADTGQPLNPQALELEVHAGAGSISAAHLEALPEHSILRAAFEFTPGKAAQAELQLNIRHNGKPVAEQWLYRWVKS